MISSSSSCSSSIFIDQTPKCEPLVVSPLIHRWLRLELTKQTLSFKKTYVAISVSPVVPRASLAFAHCPFARRFLLPLQLLGACVLLQGRIQERIGCKQEALSNYWRALQLDPFCFEALICLVRLAALTYQQRTRSLLSRSFTLVYSESRLLTASLYILYMYYT